MTLTTSPAKPNLEFAGFVFKAQPHTNPTNNPDRYGFSGGQSPGEKPLKIGFNVLQVPGFVTPKEFAADVEANRPNPVHGFMTLLGPDYRLGRFRYHRPDGSEATTEATDLRSITLDPPAPQNPAAKPTAAPKPPAPGQAEPPAPKPKPESPGTGMSF